MNKDKSTIEMLEELKKRFGSTENMQKNLDANFLRNKITDVLKGYNGEIALHALCHSISVLVATYEADNEGSTVCLDRLLEIIKESHKQAKEQIKKIKEDGQDKCCKCKEGT